MKIFELTRIKLTASYMLIIMTISAVFSLTIYSGISRNIEASFGSAEARFENHMSPKGLRRIIDDGSSDEANRRVIHNFFLEELENSKHNVLLYLLTTNLIIFILSSLIGYYLAGKTLLPIKEIVEDQKRFIADASHELKTPLTSLKTSIEVSIRSGKLPKDIQKLFLYNLEDVNALNDLIDKLLSLSILETKKVVFNNLDIKEVVKKAIKRVRYLSSKKKIKIKVATKNYQLLGNDTSLTELFTILLDNAIKYSSKGGVVKIEINQSRNFLIIKVKDEGIGINKKYLSNIFDRFYRIDSSRTSGVKSGFGLGLSMAKKIVENHKGSISVSSDIAKGTTFTIKLPHK